MGHSLFVIIVLKNSRIYVLWLSLMDLTVVPACQRY